MNPHSIGNVNGSCFFENMISQYAKKCGNWTHKYTKNIKTLTSMGRTN